MSLPLSLKGLSNAPRSFWAITIVIVVVIAVWWQPARELITVCSGVAGALGLVTVPARRRSAVRETPQAGCLTA